MKLTNKAYDVLKVIALIVLPLSEFLTSLGMIWDIPYTDQIVQTLIALDAFLGVLLKISSDRYAKEKESEEVLG